jgi:hypothetical protein
MWPFSSRLDGLDSPVFAADSSPGAPSLDAERRAARRKLNEYLKNLLPSAVDEGSGGALDGLIDAWAEQWLVKVDQDHLTEQARLEHRLGLSTQAEAEERRLLEAADLHAKLAEGALQAARDRLRKDAGVDGD